jgi:rhomboid protease GluP
VNVNLKLSKTLLHQKLSHASLFTGAFSLFLLIFFFAVRKEDLMANGDLVFRKHEYWRAWTTAFVHADYKHLGTNAVYFSILATILNNYFGNLLYPIVSLLSAGIINMIVLAFYPSHTYLVGISGVVYFMAGMWFTLYLLIERTRRMKDRIVIALGLSLIFLAPEIFFLKENVSYLAHGVGFVLGVPVAALYFYCFKKEIREEEVWKEKRPDPAWVAEWEAINAEINEVPVSPEHWHQTPDNCR